MTVTTGTEPATMALSACTAADLLARANSQLGAHVRSGYEDPAPPEHWEDGYHRPHDVDVRHAAVLLAQAGGQALDDIRAELAATRELGATTNQHLAGVARQQLQTNRQLYELAEHVGRMVEGLATATTELAGINDSLGVLAAAAQARAEAPDPDPALERAAPRRRWRRR